MEFSEAFKIVETVLSKIGSQVKESDYDGIVIKKLEASNTLDENRRSNQSHIAITGKQMDFFPYVRADGYFEVEYAEKDPNLKTYFGAQIPGVLHKENVEYLGNSLIEFNEYSKKVYVSVCRSRRNGDAEQMQLSRINEDSPDFILFRKGIHVGSYLLILKRKKELLYDFFAVKAEDSIIKNNNLQILNNSFYKKRTTTLVNLDEYLDSSSTNNNPCIDFDSKLPRNRIIFGAPGTGKSYRLENEKDELLCNGGGYERVTFYPDYTYANFVGTYKPVMKLNSDENETISYEYVPGPFMRVFVKAKKDPSHPYVLLIDEINRANVAAVFGDVFQLLDRNTDGESIYEVATSHDMEQFLEVRNGFNNNLLSSKTIKIPKNMFIWATMNSADQGVFPMDTAFKRRWDFTYLGIDEAESQIENGTIFTVGQSDNSRQITWNKLRTAINTELSKNYKINEDKLLGPFFIGKEVIEGNNEDFIKVFKNKVLMYLFEDGVKQKREKFFERVEGDKRFSTICEEFDNKGILIFPENVENECFPRYTDTQ